MKKIISIIFIFILTISFSSCKNEREYTDDNYTVSENLEIVTEKDTYPTNVEKINYTIKNNSDTDSTCSFFVYLSKLVNGEWKIISFDKDEPVELMSFIVPAKDEFLDAFIVSNYFDYPLEPGEYRLVKPGEARSNTFIIE